MQSLRVAARVLACALAVPSARAGTPGSGPIGERLRDHPELFPTELRIGVMPSGMRLVVVSRHDVERVGVATIFPHGAGADPAGKEGAAHLAEHAWFRASDGDGSVRTRILRAGGERQGLTAHDSTLFATVAPRAALEGLLALEDLRVRTGVSLATDAEIESERTIVGRELDLRAPRGIPFDWLYARLFPDGHPLHRFTIGTPESLAHVEVADVRAAGSAWQPAGATLVLTGDIPPAADLDALLRRVAPSLVGGGDGPLALGPWPTEPPAAPPPHPLSTSPELRLADLDQPTIVFSWALPGTAGADPVALDVTTALAEELLEDALEEVLPTRRGHEASCLLNEEAPASVVVCSATVGPDVFPDVVADQLATRFDALLFGEIDEKVDWRRRRAISSAQVRVLAASEGLANGDLSWLIEDAWAYHRRGPAVAPTAYAERLEGLRTAEVVEVARRWLVRDHLVSAVLVPDPSGEERRERVSMTEAEAASEEEEGLAPLPPLVTPNVRQEVFGNGLHVIVASIPGFPSVRGTLSVRAGQARVPAAAVDDLLWQTASPFWDDEGNASWMAPYAKVGSWWIVRDMWGHRFGFRGPADRLEPLLGALGPAVRALDVRFGDDYRTEWDSLRRSRRRRAEYVRTNDAVNAVLFRGHPVARRMEVSGVPSLSSGSPLAVARAFYTLYRPENAALVIVGNVDPDAALGAARAVLSGWRPVGEAAVVRLAPPPPPPERTFLVHPSPGRPTTRVGVECLLAAGGNDAREVTVALIQEQLWQRLREGMGVTYAPQASAWTFTPDNGSLVIEAPVGTGAAVAGITEILEILRRAAAGEVSAPSLERARFRAALDHRVSLATGYLLLDELARAWEEERPWDDVLKSAPERVTLEEIRARLAPCAGHEVVSVIGPALDTDAVVARWPESRRVPR